MRRTWSLGCALFLLAACGEDRLQALGDGAGGSGSGGSGGAAGPCAVPDRDGDGAADIACGGADCDDGDAAVHPGADEVCEGQVDEDCDGAIDEGCRPDGERACYTGPAATQEIGACRAGVQRSHDGTWGPCEGDVTPAAETCGDGIDSDCDGLGGPGTDEDTECCAPAAEICNGADDDCDGEIDEEIPGGCDDGTHVFHPETPSDCIGIAGRSCERIVPGGEPGSFTIDPEPPSFPPYLFYVHVPANGPAALVRMNTDSFTIDWSVTGLGDSFGPILVEDDGAVWIASGDWATATWSFGLISTSGTPVCSIPVYVGTALFTPPMTSGEDDLWYVDTILDNGYNYQRFWQIDRKAARETGVCRRIDLSPGDPSSEHFPPGLGVGIGNYRGLAQVPTARMDRLGNIWANNSPVTLLDTRTMTTQTIYETVSVDKALAAPDGGIYAPPPAFAPLRHVSLVPQSLATPDGAGGIAIFASTRSKTLWLSSYSNAIRNYQLSRYDLTTGTHQALPGPAFALAQDSRDRLWSLRHADRMFVIYDPITDSSLTLPSGFAAVTEFRGPLTAMRQPWSLRGTWRQTFDAGERVQWSVLRWQGTVPEAAFAEAYVRFGNREADLQNAERCGPFTGRTAYIQSCRLSGNVRFASVEFVLRASPWGETPEISGVEVEVRSP